MDNPYTVDFGGPIAKNSFTVRYRGLIVRDEKEMPLLFDTREKAKAECDRLFAEYVDG